MENRNMKSCRVCGAEVAKSAKTCPHCGAKLKKGHPILIGLLVLVVLIVVIAGSGDDEPKRAESAAPTQSAEPVSAKETEVPAAQTETAPAQTEAEPETEKEEKTAFYLGETAELKGVNVTLVSVTQSEGSTYNMPTEGNVFVLCEFEIANDSDREITVSSMISFDAYCDDYACNFSLSALLEKENKNQLDGTVAAGKKLNGVIGYEVPADWQELEVTFTPDFWSGRDITFIAFHEE